ncbi:hypothetical protein [Candidatus Nitrosocosmicus franklandus]|uniref:PLD phosphodiesterase domain-containing protein n=1 Tax=Candidatus Nitrosocosmicus franklandianus TaxID=1798806 RepID=A0A484IAU0_9ARCH|nr:hypothetical protein [Candidatus Nitrosocosmicus franklandus]VFJ12799.1 conserved protein of unknown function [Candidatus Nitrosocosmicus franklandus]
MDVYTLNQIKESRKYRPITTEVIHGWDQIAELSINAVEICDKGFDSVWDAQFTTFLLNNFKEGFSIGRKRMKTRGIESRFVIELTQENIDTFDLYDLGEFRHLDGIRGNFGIMDSRCYMMYILLTDNQPPAQGVFSNFKPLVEKQQKLFEQLWSMGISLPSRIKELEHQSDNFIITNPDEIENEIIYLIEQSRKEILVFSSIRVLNKVFAKGNITFLARLANSIKKDIRIKILVDCFDEQWVRNIDSLNKATNKSNHIQLGFATELVGKFEETIIISDNKYMFQIKSTNNGDQLEGAYSEEKHRIFVQEIMFEKYWNEVQSLSGISTP